jgi:hypothetical protein
LLGTPKMRLSDAAGIIRGQAINLDGGETPY